MSSDTKYQFLGAVGDFLAALFSVIFTVIGSIIEILGYVLVIAGTAALMAIFLGWATYHQPIIEDTLNFLTTQVYPFYINTFRPILNFIRLIFDPLICYWDALVLWCYGIITQVIYPVFKQCGGLGNLIIALENLILAIVNDFLVDYFLAQQFFYGPCDFTNICLRFEIFWLEWVQLYTCSCNDLGDILAKLPIIPSFFFSIQWADPQTCCAITNAVNALMELLKVTLNLVIQIIQAIAALINPQSPYAQVNFTRPNLTTFFGLLCNSLKCAIRSFENAIQLFWNTYVPYEFNFVDYFCIVDTFGCFVLNTINWFFTFIVNLDQIILYPGNPFWETVMKPMTIINLNILGAPTDWPPIPVPGGSLPLAFTLTNYYLSTESQTTPWGTFNPLYGQMRFSECLCIFINRTICDQTNNGTACFSMGAANILAGFDFCCATTSAITTILDAVTALVEFTYHLATGPSNFFLFLDRQPFTTFLLVDLINVLECLTSIFDLIPYVGYALQNLIVQAGAYALAMIEFLFRVLLGLGELPYFLIALPGVPEFVTGTDEALNYFIAIQQKLVNTSDPNSFINSLCLILNSGFPIPPPPCLNCTPGGYIQEHGEGKKRYFTPEKRTLFSFIGLESEAAQRFTPMIWYTNHTFNPIKLANMIWVGSANLLKVGAVPFPDNERLFARWNEIKECKDLKQEERELFHTRPHIWRKNMLDGKYDCDERTGKNEEGN